MLVGYIAKFAYNGKKTTKIINGKEYEYYRWENEKGSVSLGNYVLICDGHDDDDVVILHEFGHRKQSLILGWLYLIVIGIPSLMWAAFGHELVNKHRAKKGKKPVSYYWFYTEKWANYLSGVVDE